MSISAREIARKLIEEKKLREKKLIEANIKKIKKGVTPDTPIDKILDKFIEK